MKPSNTSDAQPIKAVLYEVNCKIHGDRAEWWYDGKPTPTCKLCKDKK